MSVRLAITPGDPRGIGPEVALQGLSKLRAIRPDVDAIVFDPAGPTSDETLTALQNEARERADDDRWAGEIAG